MKTMRQLKNPDIIEVNGEKFQVVDNTSEWYHTDTNELEMGVGLVKVGGKSLTLTHSLNYIYEKPKEKKLWKFFAYNKDKKEMEEVKIKSVILF